MTKKLDTKDMPYTENYPELLAWLQKHNAMSDGQFFLGSKTNPMAMLERWIIKHRWCVVITYAKRGGWDILTPPPTNDLAATLRDAEERMELDRPSNAYRACYWQSDDRQAEVRLTGEEHTSLGDDALMAEGRAEALRLGLEVDSGRLVIGTWRARVNTETP